MADDEIKLRGRPVNDPLFRRMKTVEISYDMMTRLLIPNMRHWDFPITENDFPKDAQVVRIIDGSSGWTGDPLAFRPVFRVLMVSNEWPEVPEGAYPPSFTPKYTSYESYAEAAQARKEAEDDDSIPF